MTQHKNTNSNTDSINNDKQAWAVLMLHANKILTAIIVVLAAWFGWDYYQKNYAKVDTVAADAYTLIDERHEALKSETDAEKLAKEQAQLFADIDALVAAHGDTAYAWQALMLKAHREVNDNALKDAAKTLQEALNIQLDDGITALTKIRLARVLLADGDVDSALTMANETLPMAFEATRQELLGDIYVAKNDTQAAKTAYQAAWEALRERQEVRAVLSLKLQSLGLDVEPITPKPSVVAPQAQQQLAEQAETDTQTPQTGNQ